MKVCMERRFFFLSIVLQVKHHFTISNTLCICVQGLSLVLTEGGLKDGEERDQPMEEDSADAELLPGYQWLLQDLPKLPLFDSVRGMTSTALQQVSPPQQWTGNTCKTLMRINKSFEERNCPSAL